MSQKQLKTFRVINSFIDKSITRQQAAELLSLSPRQITRLKKGLLESGAESLIHKNTGRKPAHAVTDKTKEAVLAIHSLPEFSQVNFLHFKEILLEDYEIALSYSSLSSILKSNGIESPKKKKIRHRTHRRKRKEHPGQLIQIDATPYEWFTENKKYTLHGAIDDATGNIVGLYMTQNECLFGYLEMMRQCCLDFGVPQSVYSDRHTIFRSPKTGKLTVEELIDGKTVNLTQFGRSMHELGVDMIFAKTPQVKGRIERLWVTLQSRLPVEFAKHNIKTLEEANAFLADYRFSYNRKFSVEPEGNTLFVPLKESCDIDEILCVRHQRKTDHAGTFAFKNRCFQVLDQGFPIISARREITVLINPRFGIRVTYKGKAYAVIRYLKPQNKTTNTNVPKKAIKTVMPHLHHSTDEWKKIWWQEDYNLSLKFLFELFFEKQQSSAS
ncbi:Integrase core domain-containing protein [Faecalicatena contorta]|uniref:Integrase core domain-containing protein n=1 Tax=Faecalicatena contorta TaxID=39482 RepID=A0A315ZY37_9FIRM|nr:integrase-like protein [Faecalicatena contorta]SUQ13994.1 Integrase core domain-containing protein [Faecalicatena contorta]